jgi:hypothetical protein
MSDDGASMSDEPESENIDNALKNAHRKLFELHRSLEKRFDDEAVVGPYAYAHLRAAPASIQQASAQLDLADLYFAKALGESRGY